MQNSTSSNRPTPELSKRDLRKLKTAYSLILEDKERLALKRDVVKLIESMGLRPTATDLKRREYIDQQGIVRISKDGFIDIVTRLLHKEELETEQAISLFRKIDVENKQFIEFPQIREWCDKNERLLKDEMVHQMLEQTDLDCDGRINEEDFIDFMKMNRIVRSKEK